MKYNLQCDQYWGFTYSCLENWSLNCIKCMLLHASMLLVPILFYNTIQGYISNFDSQFQYAGLFSTIWIYWSSLAARCMLLSSFQYSWPTFIQYFLPFLPLPPTLFFYWSVHRRIQWNKKRTSEDKPKLIN